MDATPQQLPHVDSDEEEFGEIEQESNDASNNNTAIPRKKFQSKFQQHQQQVAAIPVGPSNDEEDEYGDVVANSIRLPNVSLPVVTTKKTLKTSLSKYKGFEDAAVPPTNPTPNDDSDEEDYGKVEAVTKKVIKKSLSKYQGFVDAPAVAVSSVTVAAEKLTIEEQSDEEEYGEFEKEK